MAYASTKSLISQRSSNERAFFGISRNLQPRAEAVCGCFRLKMSEEDATLNSQFVEEQILLRLPADVAGKVREMLKQHKLDGLAFSMTGDNAPL